MKRKVLLAATVVCWVSVAVTVTVSIFTIVAGHTTLGALQVICAGIMARSALEVGWAYDDARPAYRPPRRL